MFIDTQTWYSICHLIKNAPGIHIVILILPFIIKLPQRVSILTVSPRITPIMLSFLPVTSILQSQLLVLISFLSKIEADDHKPLLKIISSIDFSVNLNAVSSSTLLELWFSISKCLNVGASQGLVLRALCLCIGTHALGNLTLSHCFTSHPYAAAADIICRASELQTHEYPISYSPGPLIDIANLNVYKTKLDFLA